MRTFVGVRLADKLAESFASLRERLRRYRVRVKWVEAENAHVTLRFLGEIDETQVTPIAESLETAVAAVPRFTVELHGVGAFPKVSRPKVIWVGVEPAGGPMAELKHAVDTALARYGFEEERRAFHPHFTLGRVKEPSVAGMLKGALERAADAYLGTMEVRDIAFVHSRLTPHGPVYTDLHRLPLGT